MVGDNIMITAAEMRKKQLEQSEFNNIDQEQVTELMELIDTHLNDIIGNNLNLNSVRLDRDVLQNFKTNVILFVKDRLIKEYGYKVSFVISRDINRSVLNMTIEW